VETPGQLVSEGPSPKRKAKFVIGGLAVVLIVVGLIVWAMFQPGTTFYLTVSEVLNSSQAELGDEFRVSGNVVGDSLERDGVTTSFAITDGEESLDIVTNEALPDVFWSAYEQSPASIEVIAQGTYDGQLLSADQVLAKCPSKFKAKV
jgi:cytochrome c-type biogenesis protein CcmE